MSDTTAETATTTPTRGAGAEGREIVAKARKGG